MKSRLLEAPSQKAASVLVVALPAPDGGFDCFAVQESPVVAPALAVKFPFVKTYAGQGIDDPAATARLDLGLTGFHAQVLAPSGDWYIDPYFRLDQGVYVSYFERHLPNTHGRFIEGPTGDERAAAPQAAQRVVGTQLRTYRLALAADGEYSQFHGGTVPLVHNALVTAVNRVTGIYERDLAIRLQLVANNDSLIYLNAGTDPYTNNNPSLLLSQNQSNVDSVIGNANYDIGHVFTTGGGGLAGLAVVGRTGQKAKGETGLASPVGDPFYVDYVSHEMGHQFGANHSFSGTRGSCAGNGNSSTAMEPGSGATIMAYAGICGNDNLQALGDDYFHAVSFDEIVAYTTTPGSPGNLGAAPSGNTAPVVSVVGGPFTIPARTPFRLIAAGSDADGDSLTYTWEQYDGGVLQPLDSLKGKASGALFRSFDPTSSPTRTFPRLNSILANTTNANTGTCPALPGAIDCWSEFLPTVGRQMKFRVSVRDNHAGAGGVNTADTTVTVAATAPFRVTAPDTAVSLPGSSTQTVTWNVSGTDTAPVNAANVNILLSTDGGLTFPQALASNTPNDGNQAVTLPEVATTQARVKVEAAGNVFFDVSDADFTITSGNAAPVANDDAASTPVDTAVAIDVLANDSDADGTLDPTSVVVTSGPQHGTTSVHPATGVITYTPDAGYEGPDAFDYTVDDDDQGTSAPATVSITVGSGTPVEVFPSSFTVQAGQLAGGTAASLAADDDAYLVVSTGKTTPRTATWYGTFTGVDNGTTSLLATYRGKSSVTCTQVISAWRWTDSTWVDLDTRQVGTTEVGIPDLSPAGSLADFVSGTSGPGDVRVRVSCSNTGSDLFSLSGDLLKLVVTGAGGPTHTLSITTAGTGTGAVTSSPAGINCGSDCSEAYAEGTVVTLTGTPGPSSTFAGWSGGCSGTGTCQVTMNFPVSVTATFTATGGNDVFPSSFTLLAGQFVSGSAASLGGDDDAYLVVNSTKFTPKMATWYGTITGVDNGISSLLVTYVGRASVTCTQTISIWRWTDSTWVDLDSRQVGSTEVEVADLVPSGSLGDFVSGTSGPGDVRVRVSCSNNGATVFALSGELLKLEL
jgi:hypothetical protein